MKLRDILNGIGKDQTLKSLSKKWSVDLETISKEFALGVEVESEHTKFKSVAKKIAMDHLTEDPKYYTKLKKIEK